MKGGDVTMLRSLKHVDFQKLLKSIGVKSFQAEVVKKFLYKIGAVDFEEMSTLSKEHRAALAARFTAALPTTIERRRGKDETIKLLLDWNGVVAETVLMKKGTLRTICVSVQSGCKLNCAFCATGKMGFVRNLSYGEILDQVLVLGGESAIDRIVVMGMGEPMDNLDELLPALDFLTDKNGYGMSRKKITVSTVGIPEGMKRLAKEGPGVELALSLHAVDNTARTALIPMNKKHGIDEILAAAHDYSEKANAKVTLEYLLIDGINDSDDEAILLGKISRKYKMPVNIIRFNEVAAASLAPSKRIDAFAAAATRSAIAVTVRRSKGADIGAACGQLAGKKEPTVL